MCLVVISNPTVMAVLVVDDAWLVQETFPGRPLSASGDADMVVPVAGLSAAMAVEFQWFHFSFIKLQ
ncbi:hypothetical protein A2U01_0083478, partial [Trifolium medium]|nr:hypothetical protein [Trifolium medium]